MDQNLDVLVGFLGVKSLRAVPAMILDGLLVPFRHWKTILFSGPFSFGAIAILTGLLDVNVV